MAFSLGWRCRWVDFAAAPAGGRPVWDEMQETGGEMQEAGSGRAAFGLETPKQHPCGLQTLFGLQAARGLLVAF